MEHFFLQDLVIIFALSIAVILGCHRLKIPPIVGFLITGVLVGPHGLGFIKDSSVVEVFADVGIVLLLFAIGLEFSMTKILEYRRFFFIGGAIQVFLTFLMTTALSLLFGKAFGPSVFFGFLLALSSTAIVLRLLDEKSETESPHGKLIIGILIFQDIVAIPMMLVTPLLSGETFALSGDLLLRIAGGFCLLLLILVTAHRVVPKLLYHVAKTRSRELFILSVLTLCFAVALLTSKIGLSLSLGAFLAGLLVAESEYRHEAISDVLPFQDVFTSFFFVSIGMLLDVSFLLAQPFLIMALTATTMLLKIAGAGIAGFVLKMPLRATVLAAIALCQIGEFSFVLAKNGLKYGLVDDYGYQMFLSVSLLSMGLTPLLISLGPQIASLLLHLPLPSKMKSGLSAKPQEHKPSLADHIIIVGFGLNGRQLALSAKKFNIPYIIIEMNPETVRQEKKNGEPIYFGDASHASVLRHLGIEEARIGVVVINDAAASCRIVALMRKLNPALYILVRTRYFQQMDAFYTLGANDVIPDELGTSIEIFSRVLEIFQTPQETIEAMIYDIHKDLYTNLRLFHKNEPSLYDLKFGHCHLGVESIHIGENSNLVGKSVVESGLRKDHGITIIAIKRKGEVLYNIDADMLIHEDDVLTVTGEQSRITRFKKLLKGTHVAP